MRICIGTYVYITSICAIAELRKTKVIDSINDETNEIIIHIKKKEKKIVNFFANIEAILFTLACTTLNLSCLVISSTLLNNVQPNRTAHEVKRVWNNLNFRVLEAFASGGYNHGTVISMFRSNVLRNLKLKLLWKGLIVRATLNFRKFQ